MWHVFKIHANAVTFICLNKMSDQRHERKLRMYRRSAERFALEYEDKINESNLERDRQSACFRQRMVGLARMSSTGNPASAVSVAVSNPVHMCQALFCVLSSIIADRETVHFSMKDAVLTLRKIAGYRLDPLSASLGVERITVSIGNLPRASQRYPSDHACSGLCCRDDRHGKTMIACASNSDMNRLLQRVRVRIETVPVDGPVMTDERDILRFSSDLVDSSWDHWVFPSHTDVFGIRFFEVRYLGNEVSGLPYLLEKVIRARF
jgi:hypothetical protein